MKENRKVNYETLKKEFDLMTEEKQWEWVLINKDNVTLYLDNDSTTLTFDSEDEEDDCTMLSLKADVGNRWGVDMLLSIIGVKCEDC
ncbi:MAG: hypothetical protein KAQ85_04225 [Thermodesulfovibrionia bacterium]|nr:hypothetical protein [Thermodesulfovibrionia bacterium]